MLLSVFKKSNNNYLLWVLTGWFLVNSFDALFTELSNDEAYYWMYSRFLDWGYFDHPPMVAVLDWLGYGIFPNEFGVRLFSIVLMTIALWRIYVLSEAQQPWFFGALIFSIFSLNLLGFLSLPDEPLFFFSVLFFEVYKKYLEKDTLKNTLLLSLVIACMLYSKYHGVLVVFFTVLSNWKLLARKSFWAAALISSALMIPHVLWQFNHELPSISYHFYERSASAYKISYTFDYLLGQLLFIGPPAALIMFFASLRTKPADSFERALMFNLIGIFVFFFLSSFKGTVEANWTICAVIPLLYFTLKFPFEKNKWVRPALVLSVALMFILRVHVAFPFLPVSIDRIEEFHGWKEFADTVKNKTRGLPIVTGTYQKASKLSFYSGNYVTSLNISGRRNQYDYWDFDKNLSGKTVYFLNSHAAINADSVLSPQRELYYLARIDSLPHLRWVIPQTETDTLTLGSGETRNVKLLLYSGGPDSGSVVLNSKITRSGIRYKIYSGDRLSADGTQYAIFGREIVSSKKNPGEVMVKVSAPKQKGTYQIFFSVQTQKLGEWKRSKPTVLIVK